MHCRNHRDTPFKKQKRRQDFSCRQGSVVYLSGKPKSLRCLIISNLAYQPFPVYFFQFDFCRFAFKNILKGNHRRCLISGN